MNSGTRKVMFLIERKEQCKGFTNSAQKNHGDKRDINTPYTQIHDRSLVWIGAGTSFTDGRVKLVLWAQRFHSEI